jgi:capsular polysaccharide biosynthesis protein
MAQMLGGQHAATVTLLLTSDPSADPSAAMTTNLSLVHTRAVSQELVNDLHLPQTAEAFGATVKANEVSDQLMTITVTAPTDAEAIKRISTFASVYLDFRNQTLGALANSTIETSQQRIDSLNSQIADLTKRYDATVATPGQEQEASTLLSERAQLQSEVNTAEDEVAQTKLESQAIIDASHVVDSAAVVHQSRVKHAVLAVMSGVIGGMALGLGLVLVPAVLSTRLRRRDEVARALGLAVRFSAGQVRGRWAWLFPRGTRRNAERLADGVATALPEDSDIAHLTVASIGDARDGAHVVGALADALVSESKSVAVVDLSSAGALADRPRLMFSRADPLHRRELVHVHRHDVRVSKLRSRSRFRVTSDRDLGSAEVVLTLIELDLGAGVDTLGDLADVSVVLVSAGRASAERLRSCATLLRQSGMQPAFAVLAGADDSDDSSGLLSALNHEQLTTRRTS